MTKQSNSSYTLKQKTIITKCNTHNNNQYAIHFELTSKIVFQMRTKLFK